MAPILKRIFVAPILKNIFVAPILNKNDSCGTNTEEKAIFVAPILKTFCGTNTENFLWHHYWKLLRQQYHCKVYNVNSPLVFSVVLPVA